MVEKLFTIILIAQNWLFVTILNLSAKTLFNPDYVIPTEEIQHFILESKGSCKCSCHQLPLSAITIVPETKQIPSVSP